MYEIIKYHVFNIQSRLKKRTKTSIRYTKENKKGRRRDIEREGEIKEREREERDREVKGIER